MRPPGSQIIFVDANVWFSRTLRDWIGILYTLPESPPFEVRWTEDVLAEVLYHLRREHPDWEGGRISTIRDRLAGTFEVGRVSDFPADAGYQGKDPFDAHVHAAAVACGADILLTSDVEGFRWDDNDSTYEVQHPDEFLTVVDDAVPDIVEAATLDMCRYWMKRISEADLPARLRKAGCPSFAERVRRHLLDQSNTLTGVL